MSFKKWFLKQEADAKRIKDKIMQPIIRFFDYLHVSSLFVSVLSLTLGIMAAISLFVSIKIFIGLMAGSLFFDLLDGGLVRFRKLVKGEKQAGEGFWLDYSFDRIVVIAVMWVLVAMAGQGQIYYLIALAAYIVVNLLFIFFHNRFQIVYMRSTYFFIILFDHFTATFFAIFMCAFNLLNFLISVMRKKPL